MTNSNKLNNILILIVVLIISIGCNIFQTTTSDDDSTTKGDLGRSKLEENDLEDDDLTLTMEDTASPELGSKEEQVKRKNDSKQTVVKFRKGKTSRGYKNAVIRGEKHTYTLDAGKGQRMSVNINSLENNASFYILSPSKTFVGDGLVEDGIKRFNGSLPESGKYKIVVSPTRGNATYQINFAVSVKEKVTSPVKGGNVTRTVKFQKGRTSATYSNSVIRGERDSYILGASGGQLMSVNISSLENNAVFSITSPGGGLITSERRSWSGQVPANGKYRIVVGGTRGNATYKVSFAIR